jgi:TrmH family RNA methyltransferase
METISRAEIKWVRQLHLKKNRNELRLFIAEGVKVINELLESEYKIHSIYSTGDNEISTFGGKMFYVSDKELEAISMLESPNKVLAVIHYPPEEKKIRPVNSILLDGIRDPGNMGTIIRIAHWFGIEQVVCSNDSVDVFNPKVVQSSMGSIFYIEVLYKDPHQFLEENNSLNKLPVYAATLDGEIVFNKSFPDNLILIIGNESNGIDSSLLKYLTGKLSIPSFSQSNHKAESLNAAVATAILCTEIRRKQIKNPAVAG